MVLLQDYQQIHEHNSRVYAMFHNNKMVWPTALKTGPDYTEPFYVENITDANETLSIKKSNNAAPTLTIQYSTDKTNWSTLGTTSTTALTKTLAPGDKIYLRCNTNVWGTSSQRNTISGVSKVGGNTMSLLYGSNFSGKETTFPDNTANHTFRSLFYENSNLQDASKLLLPAMELSNDCYGYMFSRCYKLEDASFRLPATTLVSLCYNNMFTNCRVLTKVPILEAQTLASECYRGMFWHSSSLNYIKCTATDISATNCTYAWVDSVSSTGTFVKKAGVTWPNGTSGIPSGWTVIEE